MDQAQERKAQNEAIFRDANEEIEAVRAELTNVDGKTPFFCECEDPACRRSFVSTVMSMRRCDRAR
jgi:hypothetical protein